ncbi:MAG: enoyl-CoA hydratase/isomerase family protein [Pirellulaceae bacterium]|nr:enoyl-CoA hydratase/isomerase family protein [Pirellulaceae bacterium]
MSVRVKVHAPSGTIILDRPQRRNALSREMLAQLQQAFEDLHQERKVRAVILTGVGSAFSSGIDLAEMYATTRDDNAQSQWYEDTLQLKELLETMWRYPKPIIAAVNGPAVAAGAALVLASDLVLATAEARFGFPEPRRGIVAGLAVPLLVFRAGGSQAARLLLTAELIDAEVALRLGIYHELLSAEQLWARGHALAERCSQAAAEALQLTRRMLNETVGEHLTTLLAAGAAASATARTTEAAAEGIAAFIQKRPPAWP